MDNKLCRLCGENEGTSCIFTQHEELSVKIMYCCAKIIVSEGDGLPAHICGSCNQELQNAYEFVKKCEATDAQFRSRQESDSVCTDKLPSKGIKSCEINIEFKGENYQNNSDIEDYFDLEHDLQTRKAKVRNNYSNKLKYNPPICTVCGKNFLRKSALNIHMRIHTGESPFSCSDCDKKYKNRGNLNSHIRKHHSGERTRNFICEHCGKGFYAKNDVKIHMRTHTGETPYSCNECPMKFTQMGALMRHKIMHSGLKPFQCSICHKAFSSKHKLQCHSQAHSNEKKYCCSICNSLFKYRNNLRKHMVLHSSPNSFVCNHCGRTFNQKGNLKLHIDNQHSEKSGYCNICSKNVPDMEVHMWRHTGQRPLKCEQCTSCFFEMKALARHINYRHKNPDKYKCNLEGCGMTFPAKTMLEFHHAKLHENNIPYPCDRCTRGFYRKNDLARHKIGTHKEKMLK